jgi:DNA replication and repair protein RecF
MQLQRLDIHDVRCLREAMLDFSATVNLVVGANGSGKTSLLEAIHLLGTGRSFRTRDPDEVIRDGQRGFLLRGLVRDSSGRLAHVALQRADGRTSIRFDGDTVRSAGQLAVRMPVTLVTPDTHVEMQTQPKARRRWVDITLFHVKPGYLELWKRAMRSVKHRNALLRRKSRAEELDAWDAELIERAEQLDRLRRGAVEQLSEAASGALRRIFGATASIRYCQGWPEGMAYADALKRGRETDLGLGSTRYGPHRADVAFELAGRPVASRLSRGQLKVWVGLLMVAQVMVIAANTEVRPLVLLDDLVSDLDVQARARLIAEMAASGCQLFVTAVDEGLVPIPDPKEAAVFHVKQGEITRSA